MQEALFAELAAGARSFACGGPSNAGGLPTTSLRRARKRRHCARSLKHDGGSGSAVFSSTRPANSPLSHPCSASGCAPAIANYHSTFADVDNRPGTHPLHRFGQPGVDQSKISVRLCEPNHARHARTAPSRLPTLTICRLCMPPRLLLGRG